MDRTDKILQLINDPSCKVSYRVITNNVDLYNLAEGDVFLIKKSITKEDANWINSYNCKCTVVTQRPMILESWDAINEVKAKAHISFIPAISQNFLHFNETLVLFGSIQRDEENVVIPNAVFISPIYRNDIEINSIDSSSCFTSDLEAGNFDSLKFILTDDPSYQKKYKNNDIDSSNGSSLISQAEKSDRGIRKQISDAPALAYDAVKSGEIKLIDLVRKELHEQLSKQYTFVSVEFKNTSVGSKEVPLTSFYKDHSIASGKLKGTWILFDKTIRERIMDVGILDRARNSVLNRLTIAITGYGRIAQKKDINTLKSEMDTIEKDYCAYLKGEGSKNTIGKIKIKVPFSPQQELNNSFDALLNYLISICPEKGLSIEKYIQDVKDFIYVEREKNRDFTKGIEHEVNETMYDENQWKNRSFVKTFYSIANTNPDQFSAEIITLLDRYCTLFYPELLEGKQQSFF